MEPIGSVVEDQHQSRSVSRSTHLFEQIHELLWKMILGGEILPRQRLKYTELATKLGASRTPVREAMRKMQQEGILLPLSQGGYQVRSVSFDDFSGLYQCRAALDGLAAREAAKRITKEVELEFGQLLDRVDRAIERENLDEAFVLNTSFHNKLVELSGNDHLITLSHSITKLTLFYRSALLNQAKAGTQSKEEYISGLKGSQETHRAIVAAIVAKNGDEARRLMEAHLLDAIDDMAGRIIK